MYHVCWWDGFEYKIFATATSLDALNVLIDMYRGYDVCYVAF